MEDLELKLSRPTFAKLSSCMHSDFPWRPEEMALEKDQSFSPILECYAKGHRGSNGYRYFVLARRGNVGYMARYRENWAGEFQECIMSLEDLDKLQEIFSNISIRLGHEMSCLDGSYGLIRVSHSAEDFIDLVFSSIEQPAWKELTDFRNELSACLNFPHGEA